MPGRHGTPEAFADTDGRLNAGAGDLAQLPAGRQSGLRRT